MCIEKLGPKGKEVQIHDIVIYHRVTYEKYSNDESKEQKQADVKPAI
jgi:hypothetical protein